MQKLWTFVDARWILISYKYEFWQEVGSVIRPSALKFE